MTQLNKKKKQREPIDKQLSKRKRVEEKRGVEGREEEHIQDKAREGRRGRMKEKNACMNIIQMKFLLNEERVDVDEKRKSNVSSLVSSVSEWS